MDPQYVLIVAGLFGVFVSLAGETWRPTSRWWIKFTFRGWVGFFAAIAGAGAGYILILEQNKKLDSEMRFRQAEERRSQHMEMVGLLRTEAALRGLVGPLEQLSRERLHLFGSRSGPMLFQFSTEPWTERIYGDLGDTLRHASLDEEPRWGQAADGTWREYFRTSTAEFQVDADRIASIYGRYLPPSVLILLDEIRSGPYVQSTILSRRLDEAEFVGDLVGSHHMVELANRVGELADTLRANYVRGIVSADEEYYYRKTTVEIKPERVKDGEDGPPNQPQVQTHAP